MKKNLKIYFFLNSHGGQISHLDIIGKELKAKYDITIVKGTYFLFDEFKGIVYLKKWNMVIMVENLKHL